MEPRREFLNNLQALRACAAGAVVFVHLLPVYGFPAPFGLFGVDVFFVLSGFIMAMLSTAEKNDFLARRIIRIVPLYWFCTLGVFAVAWFQPDLLHSTRPDLGNLLKSLFFIPYRKESGAVQPLLFLGWTLNYEMFFYLVIGAVLRLRLPKPLVWVSLIIGSLPLVGLVFRPESLPGQFYTQPIVWEFALGIGVYYLTQILKTRTVNARVCLAAMAGGFILLPYMEMAFGTACRPVLLGLPAAVLVFCAVRLERSGHGVRNRLVLLIGNASYVLYLTHPYVLQFGEKFLRLKLMVSAPERIVLGTLLVLLALAAACVVHIFVEIPVTERLKRWLRPRNRRAVPALAAPVSTVSP